MIRHQGFTARQSHVAAVYKEQMFVFGGISDGKVFGDFNAFSFGTIFYSLLIGIGKKEWSSVKSTNTPPGVWGSTAVVYNKSMYIFGGMDSVGSYSNDMYQFDFGNASPKMKTYLQKINCGQKYQLPLQFPPPAIYMR